MLKTLVKHAKKHRRIPILGTICSKDGIATATDMDVWISAPTDLPEGTYHPLGLVKGFQISADLPVTDFPVCPSGEKRAALIVIPSEFHAPLSWVLKAASKEESRYYLGGVYFDWKEEQARAVATDGHRLHSIVLDDVDAARPKKKKRKDAKTKKFVDCTAEAGAIMPKVAVRAILDLMEEQPGVDVTVEIFENQKFTAMIGDVLVAGKMIDGIYPAWRRVVPQGYAKKDTVIFNPQEIIDIMPELLIIARLNSKKTPDIKIEKGKICTRTFGKDKEWPSTIQWAIPARFNARYLSEVCGGMLSFKDPASPFMFTDRRGGVDKLAVLMPLRY